MKIFEITNSTPQWKAKLNENSKGRAFNHLEDLVPFYGSKGALQAADIIEQFATSKEDLSIKWDGKAALFYGRDDQGRFMFSTISGWSKGNPAMSPEDIKNHIMTAGKGEDWRPTMAKDFYKTFGILEQSVPKDFRGFVKGDLIFSPVMIPVEKTDQGYTFTPNKVTYTIDPSSTIGKRVAQAKVGIALHSHFNEWGGAGSAIQDGEVKQLNSAHVLALGQNYVAKNPKIDMGVVNAIRSNAQKNSALIDWLIEKRPRLSDISNILYSYLIQMTKAGNTDKISTENFFAYLPNSKVSAPKQQKLLAIHEEKPQAFPAMFELINLVMNKKNDVIDQLDNLNTDVQSSTNGERGGEGYVSLKHNVKLVPRHRWKVG